MRELTNIEKKLLEIIQERRPFEVIQISKDKSGKPDTYFIVRTQKLVVSQDDLVIPG